MGLTKKQKILLDFVDEFIKTHDYSPTFREIMVALNYKSVSTVAKHVDNLVVLGYIIKRDGEARSLEVVRNGLDPIDKVDHADWLKKKIQAKLADGSISDEDKISLRRVGEIFGVYDSI